MWQSKNKEKWKICLKFLFIIMQLRICVKIKKKLLNARELYKGRREILIAFEKNMFPLPKPYVFCENEWKKEILVMKNLCQKFLS